MPQHETSGLRGWQPGLIFPCERLERSAQIVIGDLAGEPPATLDLIRDEKLFFVHGPPCTLVTRQLPTLYGEKRRITDSSSG